MNHNWVIILILVMAGCQGLTERSDGGVDLLQRHCATCHLLPDPGSLPKKTWENAILPKMGAYLGMRTTLSESREFRNLQGVGLAPVEPILKEIEWLVLKVYILGLAPDSLEPRKSFTLPTVKSRVFETVHLDLPTSANTTSMVSFSAKERTIFYGSALTERLYQFNLDNGHLDSLDTGGAPSHLTEKNGDLFLLSMGLIHPNDHTQGRLLKLQDNPLRIVEQVISGLPRPVHFQVVNFDANKDPGFLINSFGNLRGKLSLFERKEGDLLEHILSAKPGAIKAVIQDLDQDGYQDILSLMAQGDEAIYIYYGNQDQTFNEPVKILGFPPSYGSTYFEMHDFNADGLQDILYTNGDNGDYQPVMKPYHGIRIFINQSSGRVLKFEEVVFLQVNGVFKAISADFDLDGDLDIASISYFPDFEKTPQEGFIYFENVADLSFTPQALPVSIEGHWLVMDAADYDRDGDLDLLLGSSATLPSGITSQTKQRPTSSVVLLKNIIEP